MHVSINVKNSYPFALGVYRFDGGKYPDPTKAGVITIKSGESMKRDTSGDPILIDVPGMSPIRVKCLPKGPMDAYKEVLVNDDRKTFKHAVLIRYEGIELLCGFDRDSFEATLEIDAYGTLSINKMNKESKCLELRIPEIKLSHA